MTNAINRVPGTFDKFEVAKSDRIEYKGFLICLSSTSGSLWHIETEDKRPLPKELSGNYTGLGSAKASIDGYLLSMAPPPEAA
jgi:hypothetical protein